MKFRFVPVEADFSSSFRGRPGQRALSSESYTCPSGSHLIAISACRPLTISLDEFVIDGKPFVIGLRTALSSHLPRAIRTETIPRVEASLSASSLLWKRSWSEVDVRNRKNCEGPYYRPISSLPNTAQPLTHLPSMNCMNIDFCTVWGLPFLAGMNRCPHA